ncbi:26 kDa secreted antigen [Toxocara canis]|uniref:26 kDa secreted antigen n=1 Tax=Toxocara canis TaxID=6265 RepID=A0A0B2UWT5_TOXCA|nr:26 kDa secreted antigen [Toxocara canis]
MRFTSSVHLITLLLLLAAVAIREGQGQQCADTAQGCQAGPQCFVPATQRTCRQTCKTCDCQDYASNCAAFAYLCGNATYEEVLRTRCQVTCGFCSGCEFHANGIVPRFMQLAPSRRLNVTFAGGARVDCGNTLTLDQQAGDAPAITWDVQAGALYTFIMMGPEFTPAGMPQNTLNLHWLKVDIPANNLAGGRTLADYQRAVPPPNAGLQPFVFVVYRQAGNVADQMFGDRTNFSATTFASTRNLGYPYAGNYFRMQLA